MLRKGLNLAVIASLIAVAAGLGWIAYGEVSASEKAHLDTSRIMARNQAQNMSATLTTLNDAGVFAGPDIANITSISELLDQWTPRYQRAQSAYQKFDASIVAAEKRAEAYFATHRTFTARYDPQRHAQAEAEDRAEYALYIQWRAQAHGVREQARQIIIQLDNMDTDLRKLELTSEFSFDTSGFSTVPADILALDDELTRFGIASENIRQITPSPFEAN